jgi:[CysO sulfur-carrier protein]-S-L-cysteine hydrolase
MRIARRLYEEMVDHARAEAPNECCGVMGTRDGEAVEIYPATNIHASPLRYEIDGQELLRIYNDTEDKGLDLGLIYHSHTRSEPYPSQTDVNLAKGYPDALYVIVGVAGESPEVRGYGIRDGQVTEEELQVD